MLQPEVVGPYEVIRELGRGGMGVVYEGREPTTGQRVALKLVLTSGGGAERVARFEREGLIAASLRHVGILRVHACGEDQGRPWLAYELVEGCRALDEAWTALDLRARVTLVRDAARALGFAHARGIVHRDVKPANLLVDTAGHLRVADFGLAVASDSEQLTRSGMLLGTPLYMAPEQLLGKERVGPAADVWALGLILYQALTGTRPMEPGSVGELIATLAQWRPPAARAVDPSVPPELDAICRAALARSPVERYPDGHALADDLDRFLRGEPVRAAPRRTVRSAWLLAAAGSFGAVALAVGAWLTARAPGDLAAPASVVRSSASPEEEALAPLPERSPRAIFLDAPRWVWEPDEGEVTICWVRFVGERLLLVLRSGRRDLLQSWSLVGPAPTRVSEVELPSLARPRGYGRHAWPTRSRSLEVVEGARPHLALVGGDVAVARYAVDAEGRLLPLPPLASAGVATCVVASPRAPEVAIGLEDGRIELWDAAAGRPMVRWDGRMRRAGARGLVGALAFGAAATTLFAAIGTEDGGFDHLTARGGYWTLWTLGEPLPTRRRWGDLRRDATCVAARPRGGFLLGTGGAQLLAVREDGELVEHEGADLAHDDPSADTRAHAQSLSALAVRGRPRFAVSVSAEARRGGDLRFWDLDTGRQLGPAQWGELAPDGLSDVALSPSGRAIAVGVHGRGVLVAGLSYAFDD